MVGRYKLLFPSTLILALTAVFSHGAVQQPLQAQSSPTIVCSYDPSTGAPNPLGMRTFITMTETGGTTEVTYEQLGSFVPGPVEAVLANERSLIFPNTSIDEARQLLLNTTQYYRELIGFNDPEGFGPVNNTLICRASAVASPAIPRATNSAELPDLSATSSRAPLPNLSGRAGSAPSSRPTNPTASTPTISYGTIAGLADGNYRYVSGPANERVYSDQELVNRGGVLFVFSKTGNSILGNYSYIDGESICVTGRVSGNTVTGQAYPANGVTGEDNASFWGPATFLQVRRPQGEDGAQFYGSATLELNDFSRINAGGSLPPSSCQ